MNAYNIKIDTNILSSVFQWMSANSLGALTFEGF